MRHTRVIGALVRTVLLLSVAADEAASQIGGQPPLIVPHESWTCGLPNGIPIPESGTLIFQAVRF